MDTRILDHDRGYGMVSRAFHWATALLLAWQLVSAAAHFLIDDTPVADALFSIHPQVGFTILVLTILRGAWGLYNVPRRPIHAAPVERAAIVGHVALYAALVIVPGVALIRQYGSGRGFSWLGIQIFPAFEPKIEWMTAFGNAWHGALGWVLFLLIAGHVTMAFVHQRVWDQRMIERMTTGTGDPGDPGPAR